MYPFSKLLRLLPFFNNAIAAPYQEIAYVRQTVAGYPVDMFDKAPWVAFGSTEEEFHRWIKQVCGICCLKMVGDTFGLTNQVTIYELTMKCFAKGGFKIGDDGVISGVYHYPLIALAQELGLHGAVERDLTPDKIRTYLAMNKMVMLSIDLQKDTPFNGNHLILVHRYLKKEHMFLVHDSACAVGEGGMNISMTEERLVLLSNQRGMTLWK